MSWRGQTSQAEQLYRMALLQNQRNISALNNLAILIGMSGGSREEALRLIQTAIDSGGPRSMLLDSRGLIHYFAGQFSKAADDFNASVEGGESAVRCFHVALAAAALKQPDKARDALERAQSLQLDERSLHPLERPLLAKLKEQLGM